MLGSQPMAERGWEAMIIAESGWNSQYIPMIITGRDDKVKKTTDQKAWVYDTWSADCMIFARVIFWKWAPSQLEYKNW